MQEPRADIVLFNQDKKRIDYLLKRILFDLLLFGLLIILVLFLIHSILCISYPYDITLKEGVLLIHGKNWLMGKIPYNDISSLPYLINGYPPVYTLLSSILDYNFISGRIISLIASLLSGLLIFIIIRKGTQNNRSAWLASLFFYSFTYTIKAGATYSSEMLALFFSLLGLYVILSNQRLYLSTLFFVLAFFIHEETIAAPLASFIYLRTREKISEAWISASLYLFLTLIISFLLSYYSQGQYILHIFIYNLKIFNYQDLGKFMLQIINSHTVITSLAIFYLIYSFSRSRIDLALGYLIFSLLIPLLFSKIDSHYYLNIIAAFCLISGFALSELDHIEDHKSKARLGFFIPVLLIVNLIANVSENFAELPGWSLTYERQNNTAKVIKLIQTSAVPIFCESPALNFFAGTETFYHPEIMPYLTKQKLWEATPLLLKIREQFFAYIILNSDVNTLQNSNQRFSPLLINAIQTNYALDKILFPYYIYRPQPQD